MSACDQAINKARLKEQGNDDELTAKNSFLNNTNSAEKNKKSGLAGAKTLSAAAQEKILEDAVKIKIGDGEGEYKVKMSSDGKTAYYTNDKGDCYRVVNNNGNINIIHSKVSDNGTSTSVYEAGKYSVSKDGSNISREMKDGTKQEISTVSFGPQTTTTVKEYDKNNKLKSITKSEQSDIKLFNIEGNKVHADITYGTDGKATVTVNYGDGTHDTSNPINLTEIENYITKMANEHTSASSDNSNVNTNKGDYAETETFVTVSNTVNDDGTVTVSVDHGGNYIVDENVNQDELEEYLSDYDPSQIVRETIV